MASFFNLKSVFTADTSDLKKGSKEAKQAVKDFEDATTSALSDVTSLFGASMKEINTSLSTVKGGLMAFTAALKTSTQGVSLLSKAMGVLKVALAATGIGAILVALGSLVAYFTKSQRGANQLSIIVGQLGQAFKTAMDYVVKLGEGIVNVFRKPKETLEELWKLISDRDYRRSKLSAVADDFNSRQEKSLQLTKAQIALEEKQRAFTVERAKLQTEINRQRLIADDKLNYTTEQRLAAAKKADELTNQLYSSEIALKKELLEQLKLENSLSESMNADLQAEADLEAEIIALDGQKFSALKELVTKQAELTALATKEREEKERIAKLNERKAQDLTLKPIDSSELLKGVKVESEAIVPKIDTSQLGESMTEIQGYMVDLTKIAIEMAGVIADAFGQMVEGLITGNLNVKEIFGTILTFLAENLKAVGKALVAWGAAMKSIKLSLSNPGAAIAAGAALVAAGAVLSGLVNNMISSVESSATPAASYAAATVSGGNLDLSGTTLSQQKAQEVKVTGTIKASGRELAIILENEKQRKNLVG